MKTPGELRAENARLLGENQRLKRENAQLYMNHMRRDEVIRKHARDLEFHNYNQLMRLADFKGPNSRVGRVIRAVAAWQAGDTLDASRGLGALNEDW